MQGPTGVSLPYRFERRGRTRLMAVGLMVGLSVLLWGIRNDTPLFYLVWIGLLVFGTAYLVIFAPRWGVEVTDQAVTYWAARVREHFTLDQIARIHFEHDAEGADVTIHLRDGRKLDIPHDSMPDLRILARAFQSAGLNVT